MYTLIDFQEHLLKYGEAIYSIERAVLNPTDINVEEIKNTSTQFKKTNYSNEELKKYISDNSKVLTKNGNLFKGKVKGKTVYLTILKTI